VSGNLIVKHNANTADTLLLAIWTNPGPAVGSQPSTNVGSGKAGPAGTYTAPAQIAGAGQVRMGEVQGARTGGARNPGSYRP
jgi:hypothetical protein